MQNPETDFPQGHSLTCTHIHTPCRGPVVCWCVGGAGPAVVVWVELGQLLWYGWSWASCCGMGGAGPAVVVWVELGQLSWYGWSWASCRGIGGAGPAVPGVVWVKLALWCEHDQECTVV